MYIITENNGIINLDHYPRVGIYQHQETHILSAITVPDSIKRGDERITIAKYNQRVDADYTLLSLYSALAMGSNTWDPRSVISISQLWCEVKQEFSSDNNIWGLTKNAILNLIDTNKLTITYPAICNDWGTNLEAYKQQVSQRIIAYLGKTPIEFYLWEPSDQISIS